MSKLQKISHIDSNQLDKTEYMQSLLQSAADKGMITARSYDKIKSQMAALLTDEIERYTVGQSSSVRVEKAEEIFRSVAYTIGLFLKTQDDGDSALKALERNSLLELHQLGRQLLNRKIAVAKLAYLRTVRNRIKTPNIAYNDTIRKGIFTFFRAYDSSFGADETPAAVDYPLCIQVSDVSGIEYILKYLNALYFENIFLKKFSPHKIDSILRGYHAYYEELLINIFEHVLLNAMGCVILGKSVYQLSLDDFDREKLYRIFFNKNTEELTELLKNNVPALLSKMNIQNSSLENYIMSAIVKISPEIRLATEKNRLSSVFLPEGKRGEKPFSFEDGQRLPDDRLTSFLDELRDCRFVSDKIKMIETLKSFADLLEVLKGDCLFEKEFEELFSALKDTSLALLYREVPEELSDLPESDRQWMAEFSAFFETLSEKRKGKILSLAKNFGGWQPETC